MTTFIGKNDVGLYRDAGLIILRQLNGEQTERVRKRVTETFKFFGFKIKIMTNLPDVNFLDATFDLRTNTYRPYRKPNNFPIYIHMSSNHPPEIAKVDNIENNTNELQRKRKIIWLNLLFNKSIATNVG